MRGRDPRRRAATRSGRRPARPTRRPRLRSLGAAGIVPRDEVTAESPRPLESARWAGAVDTVGGRDAAVRPADAPAGRGRRVVGQRRRRDARDDGPAVHPARRRAARDGLRRRCRSRSGGRCGGGSRRTCARTGLGDGRDRGDARRRWSRRSTGSSPARPAAAGSSGSQPEARLVELAAELGERPRRAAPSRRRPGRASGGRPRRSEHARRGRASPARRPSGTRPSGGPRTPGRRRCRGRARPRRSTSSTRRSTVAGQSSGIAVAEERRRVGLEEVAGEQDVGVGDEDHDVVVGVAAAEVAQLDRPAARLDLDRRRRRSNVRSGGSRTTSASSAASSGIAAVVPGAGRSPVVSDHRHAALVAPDRRRPERGGCRSSGRCGRGC